MSNFEFISLAIPDVMLIKSKVFRDERGFFLETYKQDDFAAAGIAGHFPQDNHSYSRRNVLRGLHYQIDPFAQGKLVRCVIGRIFDVAIDIRRGSPYYGKWVGSKLSDRNQCMLYVPPGFAHGFVVLSESAEVSYKCTCEYSPKHDRGIIWNDPDIGIEWPVSSPILSAKDAAHPGFKNADNPFVYGQAGQ
jgi:dTDP-4-dehydrorhamnose 3,5-epimerase